MINGSVDTSAFKKAARALFETSSRSCVDFTNGQALRVSIEAVRQTEKANKDRIEHELGVTGREFRHLTRGKNKGKVKLGNRIFKDDSLAARILGKRMKTTKSFGFKGVTDIGAAMKKLLAARLRSVAFIKAGWIPARNKLFSVVKRKPVEASRVLDSKIYGKPKGDAKPAVNASLRHFIEAIIVNSAMNTKSKGNPMPVAQKGLQKALQFVAQDMTAKLAERLRGDLRPFGAK